MRFGVKGGMALLGLLVAATGVSGCGLAEKKTEDTYVDFEGYYGQLEDGQYAVIVDGEKVGVAITRNEKVYIPLNVVVENINDKFYYDEAAENIRYTTESEVVIIDGKSNTDIAMWEDTRIEIKGDETTTQTVSQIHIEMDYLFKNSDVSYSVQENPNRIVVFSKMGETKCFDVSESAKLRVSASESSDIIQDLESGQRLYYLEEELLYGDTLSQKEEAVSENGWMKLVTESGVKGYVKEENISEMQSINLTPTYEQKEYTHILLDEKVCLGWHLVTNTNANNTITEKIAGTDGMNVISPTWFSVTDTQGNISSIASKSYVKTAHNKGLSVWALVSDFEYDENGEYYAREAMANTQSRQKLIDNLMNEVREYDIDGINVDFENVSIEYGADYIQFIRELSIACRKEAIVLSVDLYVPMSYNQYYGREAIGKAADYVIIMGYDEHWAGCEEAGSVASINYVKNGINNTLKCVDADRVINAIPFYTRIWKETPDNGEKQEGIFVEDSINGNYYLTNQSVSMETAESSIAAGGAQKYWLDDIGQYYAEYEIDGALNRVWLEEEDSIRLKLDYMKEKKLAGVACWQLGLEKDSIWDVIREYLNQ